jgi:hypothetical protein
MLQPMPAWTLQHVLGRCVAFQPCLSSGVPGLVAAWRLVMLRLLRALSAWA